MAEARDISIGKRKAKRLGVDPNVKYTRSELTAIEMGSGQYVEQNGKTFAKSGLTESGEVESRSTQQARAVEDKAKIEAGKVDTVNREPIVLNNELVNQEEQVVDKGFDIAEYRERDTVGGKVVKAATSIKTTAILAGVLATLATFGGATAGGTAVSKAAIVGRTASTGGTTMVRGGVPIAKTFLTNSKSIATSTSYLTKMGGALKNPIFVASALVGAIGSYPFAGFIKEEALQTLGFAVRTAQENEDVEAGKIAIEQQLEILNPTLWDKLIGSIPYANVVKQLKDFYKAATTKLKVDARAFEKLEEKLANPPETFEESSNRLADERRARELGEREEDEAYYDELRRKSESRKEKAKDDEEDYWKQVDEKNKAKEEERTTADEEKKKADEEYYSNIEEENKQNKIQEQQDMAKYYDLIRAKKYDEAAEWLELLKGGS